MSSPNNVIDLTCNVSVCNGNHMIESKVESIKSGNESLHCIEKSINLVFRGYDWCSG